VERKAVVADDSTEKVQGTNTEYENSAEIQERALYLEKQYFTDLLLKDYEQELGVYKALSGTKRRWAQALDAGFDEIALGLSIYNWSFEPTDNLMDDTGAPCEGICDPKVNTIWIDAENLHDDTTLLHEMIHAYDSVLYKKFSSQRDYVVLRLYEALKNQIPDLLQLISVDLNSGNITHSLLFILKSLDLDLRLDKPLGTVYSYGRERLYRGKARRT
jgi:hypothetical protein